MIDGYRAALSSRHADLEAKIAAEAHRPIPDSITLAELKRAKLRIKEALAARHH